MAYATLTGMDGTPGSQIDQQVGSTADGSTVLGAANGQQVNVGGNHHHAAPDNAQQLVQHFVLAPTREAERPTPDMPTDDRTNERLDRIYQELASLRMEVGTLRGELSQIQRQLAGHHDPTQLNWNLILMAMMVAAVVSLATYLIGVR